MALLLAAGFFLAPIAGIVALSCVSSAPLHVTPAHYVALLSEKSSAYPGTFGVALLNALVLAGFGAVLALLVGMPAAYALARFRFRGGEAVALTLLVFGSAPPLLVLLPLRALLRQTGLDAGSATFIWSEQLLCLPPVLWILCDALATVPRGVENAWRVDGHSQWHITWRVALPMAAPGIAAASLLAFMLAWTDPLAVLAPPAAQSATSAALALIAAPHVRYSAAAAACVLSMLPIAALALYCRRWLFFALRLITR